MKCIICNEEKRKKGRPIPLTFISVTEKAEKTLKEFSELHIKNNNQKYLDGVQRILLALGTKSLLAADVAYHKQSCYEPFRSNAWKRQLNVNIKELRREDKEAWEEFCQIVKIHIIIRGEVHTSSQLKSIYDEIRTEKNLSGSSRSVDVKEKLLETFGDSLIFKQSSCSNKSELVVSKENDSLFNAENIVSSLPCSLVLKKVGNIVHNSVKSTTKDSSWPPTPQDIIESNCEINKDLFNLLSWIICPDSKLDDSGIATIPKTKREKVRQLVQNIVSLLPNFNPCLGQALLSLTMHRQTGSSNGIDTLHKLGYGLPYTETIFIEDKWAKWAENQSSIFPSNIKESQPTTHVADNIDWENRSLAGSNQTHNTNSIFFQHTADQNNTSITLIPDYNFIRSSHRSFKAKVARLPQFKGTKKNDAISSGPIDSQTEVKEFEMSTVKYQLWAYCIKKMENDKEIPAWSSFQKYTCNNVIKKAQVGYSNSRFSK